jgi:hypothetical protein
MSMVFRAKGYVAVSIYARIHGQLCDTTLEYSDTYYCDIKPTYVSHNEKPVKDEATQKPAT